MNKSGLYINGKKVCDVTDKTNIKFVPKSINIQGGSMSIINSSNKGFINQDVHSGDIHIEESKIIVNGKEFLIDEYTNQHDVKIEIYGDVESVYTQNGNLNVSANNIESVKAQNGAITVSAKSVGSVKTQNGVINKL